MSTNFAFSGSGGGIFYDTSRFDENNVLGSSHLTNHLQKLSNQATTKFNIKQGESQLNAPTNTENEMRDNNATKKLKYPINEALYKLDRAKLALPHQNKNLKNDMKTSNQPIYYKPPSSRSRDDQYGIKKFLPPNFNNMSLKENKNKIPLVAMQQPVNVSDILPNRDSNFDDIDDNAEYENPSGNWLNPIVKEAMSRQVNKEFEVKSVIWNLIYFISFELFISFMKYLLVLYDIKKLPFQKSNGFYPPIYEQLQLEGIEIYALMLKRAIYFIFIFNSGKSLYKIMKGQDQCHDLPLTDKQRMLLGLSVGKTFDSTEDADLVIKNRVYQSKHKSNYKMPKYSKLNAYSMYQFKKPQIINPANQSLLTLRSCSVQNNDSSNQIKQIVPIESIHSSNLSRIDDDSLKAKFEKHFDIKMNYSDEEELMDKTNILESVALPTSNSVNKSVFRRRYGF